MPIYEYRCSGCGKEFEVMQRITEEPLKECEDCSGELEKLISQSAFVLKGTGWYKTDFADKKPATGGEKSEPKAKADKAPDCGSCPAAKGTDD
ncbi:MAG: FmdB family zinc ribbon protein [Thermodesulfobacteriota bacterium]